ncbi:MAG: rod shape-determining protein MreD [Neisseria sp.]|nr:rod shape-determining protein MreD [Neisseria sp.]
MTDFNDFYNRLPKGMIASSFAVALLIDLMPFPVESYAWLPEWTAMMLLYWTINRPQTVGIITAFSCGILLDIGITSLLGLHALSYMLMTFFIHKYQRYIVLQSYGFQAVAVFVALMGNQIFLMLARLLYTHRLTGWLGLLAPLIGALLWPMLNKIMLSVSNLRRRR